MINRVILVGRLTKDPQMSKTQSGLSRVPFTLAVSRRKSKDSNNQPDADFISCVAWNQTAELLCQYMRKGSQIGVEGRIQTRNYDDPNSPGRKVYVTEVVCESITFLESKNSTSSRASDDSVYYPDDSYENVAVSSTLSISNDDLPF